MAIKVVPLWVVQVLVPGPQTLCYSHLPDTIDCYILSLSVERCFEKQFVLFFIPVSRLKNKGGRLAKAFLGLSFLQLRVEKEFRRYDVRNVLRREHTYDSNVDQLDMSA